MLGFAHGRDLTAVVDAGAPAQPRLRPFVVGGHRLSAAKRVLDGIGGLGWSIIGFVLGAVFWHFVGFWGFVSEVVLAGGPPPSGAVAAIYAPMLEARSRWVQVADASPSPCTLLVLDRRTGLTSARPCEDGQAPLPADAFEGREDRVIASGRRGLAPLTSDGAPDP